MRQEENVRALNNAQFAQLGRRVGQGVFLSRKKNLRARFRRQPDAQGGPLAGGRQLKHPRFSHIKNKGNQTHRVALALRQRLAHMLQPGALGNAPLRQRHHVFQRLAARLIPGLLHPRRHVRRNLPAVQHVPHRLQLRPHSGRRRLRRPLPGLLPRPLRLPQRLLPRRPLPVRLPKARKHIPPRLLLVCWLVWVFS